MSDERRPELGGATFSAEGGRLLAPDGFGAEPMPWKAAQRTALAALKPPAP